MSIGADWENVTPHGRNVLIEISKPWGTGVCDLHCSFEIDELRILEVEAKTNTFYADEFANFRRKRKRLAQSLLSILLKPFKYKRALSGLRPNDFVGEIGTWVRVEAVVIEDYTILVFHDK